ncbi:MAG TPA: glycoside hydrolase [Verrucomicrobiae bacterium]|nr:glycoside hydrolase [Verrucomicrobiae bacterium]
MKNYVAQFFRAIALFALLAMFDSSSQAQSVVITNYTFDASASASPPVWRVWNSGIFQYVTNQWDSSDADDNPDSGSLLITSVFNGANQQSVVWTGDYSPALNGAQITNFSCYIRFDPSSATNASSMTFGTIVFYLDTTPGGAYPQTQIGGYYSVPAGNTNWVFFSVPVNISSSVYGIMIQLQTYGNALSGTSKMYVDDVQLTGTAPQPPPPPISGVSTVDWNNVHQRIDGFGASSAWNGTWNASEADLLFSTNNNISYKSATYNGAGLSLLRNHIAYASTTSASAVPTTVETSIMQMAQARGAQVWSTPWTPPAGFKNTNDIYDSLPITNAINGGSYLGSGNNITNVNYASQLANYVASMKNTYGINLYAISVQNEPDASVNTYEACQWTGAQIHDFTTNLYNALTTMGVSSTKIIIPESENWTDPHNLAGPTLNDPNTAADVSIIANHNYVANNAVGDQTAPAALNTSGKALWETEVALLSGNDNSIANGVYYAQRIYQYMTQAQANAYHYWWLVSLSSTSGNEGLLDNNAAPTKRLFTFGQYSRFIRPNFYRINATSSQPSALISAYKDSNSPAFAIVVVNTNVATDVIQTFNLTNFTAASVTPWITSDTLSLTSQMVVNVTNASFTYTIPAMSVVTFVGQTGVQNTAPVLAPVPDETDNVGVTLLVTNTATDSDLPPQTLTFSPVNSLPANATINSSNGIFNWRPLVSQANTTNLIQIQVTDNGSPNLSATNSFNVIVNAITNPIISSVNLNQGQFRITINGPQGPDYTLLTSTNLMDWQTVFMTNSPVTPFILTGINFADPTRFYRIQIGP